MLRRAFSLVVCVLSALCVLVLTSTADDGPKYQRKAYSPGEVEAIKASLGQNIAKAQRVNLEHDSDPLRGKLEGKKQRDPAAILATASIVVDDGTPSFITLFGGTAPTYFWGNTFTNPGTGTFTVASVTPYVNGAARPDTFFCTGTATAQLRGDGVATVAAVAPGGAALGTATGAIPGSGFVSVPMAVAGPPGSSFVAGHLIDAVDCGGGLSTANHFGEFVFFDTTGTGGGSGTGLSNAFLPGGFTSAGFPGAAGTRTIFTRATIVGPNVPVELTQFSVD